MDWIDNRGNVVRTAEWRHPRVAETNLHPTEAGLALQTNQQTFWWLGKGSTPLWNISAKPYIYRVHSSPGTDVFIGTDGNGGRLLGIDAVSGRETLNVKPAIGGFAGLAKVLGHDVLVSAFSVSRSWSVPRRLFVMSMNDRRHILGGKCFSVVGTWEDGAVCRAGQHGERLAIADIRTPASLT